jgi:hypothetical protein
VPYCVNWQERTQIVPDQQAFNQQMDQAAQVSQGLGEAMPSPDLSAMPMKDQRVYDGPVTEIGNIFDFVIERHPNNPDYAPRCMRSFKSKAYLLDMENNAGYSVYEGIEDLQENDGQNEPSDNLKREVYRLEGFVDPPKGQVELLQFEGDLELPGENGPVIYKNHIMVIANRSKVIRFEPSPFAHGKCSWNMFVLYPEPGEVYGRGIIEPALGLQDVINVRVNQVIEANTLIINPMYEVVQDGVFDVDEWVSAPGAIAKVATSGNIRPIQEVPQAALGFQEVGWMMSQHNQSTGAQASFTSEAYQKSATEVAAQSGMTQSRNAETIKHIEYNCLTPIVRMQMQLNQQLMDEAVWIRVVGDPQTMTVFDPQSGQPVQQQGPLQLKVSPQDIEGNFDVYAVGASNVANSQQQMSQTIQLMGVISQNQEASKTVKWNALTKDLFSLARLRNSWKYIKTDQELQQEQMQEQQQQMQQMQMQKAENDGQQNRVFAEKLMLKQTAPGSNQESGDKGGHNSAGSQSGPRGISSMVGLAEQHGAPTNGPHDNQLAGPRR